MLANNGAWSSYVASMIQAWPSRLTEMSASEGYWTLSMTKCLSRVLLIEVAFASSPLSSYRNASRERDTFM